MGDSGTKKITFTLEVEVDLDVRTRRDSGDTYAISRCRLTGMKPKLDDVGPELTNMDSKLARAMFSQDFWCRIERLAQEELARREPIALEKPEPDDCDFSILDGLGGDEF
jgi:hypothetical protein